jgi:hypothetical protein
MHKKTINADPPLPGEEEIRDAFERLFSGRPSGQTSKSKLRYVVVRGGYTLLEQNPHKTSPWAQQARDGHQVAWLMPGYRAVVVDGAVQLMKRRRTSPE